MVIIPGFGETVKQSAYQQIAIFAHEKGYNVLMFIPRWQRHIATDWLNEFQQFIQRNVPSPCNTLVIGFSFGAYIAINSARHFKFKKILLCSLSPYFRDDIPKLPAIAYKILGKKRIQDFKKYAFPLAIRTPAIFFVGDKDMPLVIERSKKAFKQRGGPKKFELVSGAEHEIDKKYLEIIKKYI